MAVKQMVSSGAGVDGRGGAAPSALIEQFNSSGDLAQALLHGPTTVLDLVPAPAAALHLDGVTTTIGDAPELEQIEDVVALLRSTRRQLPVASDSLAADHPRMAHFLPGVAGLLIVPIDGSRGFLAWFRPAHTEPWHGLVERATRFSRDLDGAILRNLHAELARFGFHDALTGLSNGRLLVNRIEHALDGPTRGAGLVLVFVDIDAFNAVNGALGHARGDQFLIQTAERLRSVTRDSDTVARLGGDEFVILAIGARRVTAARIAERVRAAFERPIAVSGSPVRTTVSIGIAEAEPDDDAPALLERARTAMLQARDSG